MPDPSLAFVAGFLLASLGAAGAYFLFLRRMLRDAVAQAEKAMALRTEEAEVRGREEFLALRERLEHEFRQREAALARQEQRLLDRDDALESRRAALECREDDLRRLESALRDQQREIEALRVEAEKRLTEVSALTPEEAKQLAVARWESEALEHAARRAKEIEFEWIQNADRRAKSLLLDTMQRSVADYVTEAALAVIELPSEDMKGRLIGREGRNIRAFEQTTGVDLIIDETPEAVVLSCFDPVRREIARLTLMNLMLDGRIHPGRIEELHEKAQKEVDRMIREAGERACDRANIAGLPAAVVETLGKLRFRTSYAQNVLDHSVEVARLCTMLASELGLHVETAKRAGLLHDIGKALGPEWEGPHALIGMEFLRSMGELEPVLHAVGAHHYEIDPSSPEAQLVILADTLSAARPGARRESLENYLKRLSGLEALANSFPGVERSYAVQAGREIRLIVKPEVVDDLGAVRLANEVARRIEREMEYPGQIKVTVIRETRASDFAK
jgi:ribonuclease Y